jgi:hypothetical protein
MCVQFLAGVETFLSSKMSILVLRTHPAWYSVGTMGSFPENEAPDHSFPFSAEVWCDWSETSALPR